MEAALPANALDMLTGVQTNQPKQKDASEDAQTMFLDLYGAEPTSGVGVCAQALDRRKKVFHILMSFCDDEEAKLIRSRKVGDMGKRRQLVQKLEKFFAMFLASVYIGHKVEVPDELKKALPDSSREKEGTVRQKRVPKSAMNLKAFKVTTYENRNAQLKRELKFVLTIKHKPSRKLFRAWRTAFEEKGELRPVTEKDSLVEVQEARMDAHFPKQGGKRSG